jgi:molecular chaperone GrpE (heat shock protein)
MAHDPTLTEERREAARLGGKGKARIARLGKLVPPRLMSVYDALEEALGQVHDGQLDPRIAQAMSSLASAMVKVLTSGELEERVRRLEERQPSNNGRRRPR